MHIYMFLVPSDSSMFTQEDICGFLSNSKGTSQCLGNECNTGNKCLPLGRATLQAPDVCTVSYALFFVVTNVVGMWGVL